MSISCVSKELWCSEAFEELRACKKMSDEALRAYIRRWTAIQNSVSAISEDRAMDAFTNGVYRKDFREALGRQTPKNMAELMKLATEWADGEDAVQSKTTHSRKRHHDRRDSRDHRDVRDRRDRDDKQRRRDYDHRAKDKVKFVAAGFS